MLGQSWGGLGVVLGRSLGGLGDLRAVWGEHVVFSLVLYRFGGPVGTARLPNWNRARPVHGVRGTHESVPQELGLVDLDLGLLTWCFVQVIYTPLGFFPSLIRSKLNSRD